MANPLTLYVPIKQDAVTQAAARLAYANFVAGVTPGLNATQNVHFARMALIPNATGGLINAILLLTEFDQAMTPYLNLFWTAPGGGVKNAFIGLAQLALNPPADPQNFTFEQFVNFIVSNNLSNDTSTNYSAYPQLVSDILQAFPPSE